MIGRNEGERLRKCLASIAGAADPVVYVDSGSTDRSADLARAMGTKVVALDMRMPFTAARARNAGFTRMQELASQREIEYVQFVDGDCEIAEGWLPTAARFLKDHAQVAAVCGRRREKFPRQSVYNLLCDFEWDTPVGRTGACGGDAMMRVRAFEEVGGFCGDLIAGEEPDLCIRLRAAGWQIWRLDSEMTLHDAAILRFSQWWRRSMRFGHALAEGVQRHGSPPERHWIRESRSAWFWGLVLPLCAVACLVLAGLVGLIVLAGYPLQVARLAARGSRSTRENWLQAFFLVLGKFPEMLGQAAFFWRRLVGIRSGLVEYK